MPWPKPWYLVVVLLFSPSIISQKIDSLSADDPKLLDSLGVTSLTNISVTKSNNSSDKAIAPSAEHSNVFVNNSAYSVFPADSPLDRLDSSTNDSYTYEYDDLLQINPSVGDYSYYSDADYWQNLPTSENISDPSRYTELFLQKCNCDFEGIWNGISCSTYDAGKTFVAVLDSYNMPHPIPTSFFGAIKISGINCSESELKTTFPGGNFNLLPNLQLLHILSNTFYHPGHYCVDHVLDKNGDLSWQAEVCVPLPRVSKCCGDGEAIDFMTGMCYPYTEVQFNPPITLENTLFSRVEGGLITLECAPEEEIKRVRLGDGAGELLYTGVGTAFTWSQSTLSPPIAKYQQEYCVAPYVADGEQEYLVSFCYKDAMKEHLEQCTNATCVRKCCGMSEFFNADSNSCDTPNDPVKLWQPSFHRLNGTMLIEDDYPHDLNVLSGRPLCAHFYLLEANIKSEDQFYLFKNGSLHVPIWSNSVNSTSYCVDNWQYGPDKVLQHAMVCFPDEPQEVTGCQILHEHIYPFLLIISCAFLAITLVVYAAVPELHAKVHGKSLVSHVTSLLVAYISLVVVQWGAEILPMTWCVAMGE